MPKQRQIPFLFGKPMAAGGTAWHWKPSARLRALGFTNQALGTDRAAAIARALELNDQVAAIKSGAPATAAPRLPRVVRFAELVQRYRASEAYTDLRPSTRREYEVRLRQLEHWAMDGTLAVRDIDGPMVGDLYKSLYAASRHRAAATMRVLRLLLNWGIAERLFPGPNAVDTVKVKEAPSRRTVASEDARRAIVAAAARLKLDDVVLAHELAVWILQRQADILSLNRFQWRELKVADADPRHIAQLVDGNGRIMGFRLRQQKTGAWIDAPVPPRFHATIEARLAADPGGFLFPHTDRPGEQMPNWMFQRRTKQARDAAIKVAAFKEQRELAEELARTQFRDLRRTGMVFYGNAGAQLQWITALSGHAVIGKKTILDTYMPGNTPAAVACVATGMAYEAERAARERQA